MIGSIRDLRARHIAAALCCVVLLVLASQLRAHAVGTVRLGETAGGLLLRTGTPGLYLPAPTLATDVEIEVSGVIARTTVRQRFHNPSDGWVEGVYVFPLPERAAVDTLRMRIGDRLVEGRVEERRQARATYEQAAREGRHAALLEQERPNLFTTSVANIGPDQGIVVEIQYQERLVPDAGRFALRFPMVVAPRYIPRGDLHAVGATGTGLSPDTAGVPEASRITPPVSPPAKAPDNRVTLAVTLAPGLPPSDVESPYHPVHIDHRDPGRLAIRLVEGDTRADRDFVLRWRIGEPDRPAAAALQETTGKGRFGLLLIAPPTGDAEPGARPPREVIYAIDVSGSMAGESIRQARAALLYALGDLGPEDRFNVIAFNHEARRLFVDAVTAGAPALANARRFVAALEAGGGTEIGKALELALPLRQAADRLRQVVFVTDGAVGNEAELFAMVERRRADSRVFTVGIGSAPNSHLMRGIAGTGRGSFTHIGAVGEVEAEMRRLLDKLRQPVLTDLAVTVDGAEPGEAYPWPLPDLYAGEPVALALKLPEGVGRVTVTGRLAGRAWSAEVPLERAVPGRGLDRLWARERIAALETARLVGMPPDRVDEAILATALDHRLISRLTSLVAVDITPARPADRPLDTRDLPLDLPQGWQWDKVFGGPAPSDQIREALRAGHWLQLADAGIEMAKAVPAATDAAAPPQSVLALPQTATAAPLHLLAGLAALLLAAGCLAAGRRRRAA